MFKGSNNVALGYDEGSILIKVCQLFHAHCTVISVLHVPVPLLL